MSVPNKCLSQTLLLYTNFNEQIYIEENVYPKHICSIQIHVEENVCPKPFCSVQINIEWNVCSKHFYSI